MVICVPFTDLANCSKIYPSQALIRKGVGGLARDSVALCEQVRAITVTRLKTHIGHLDQQMMSIIDERLKIALDLD